ncbi:MAG: hypothetical protein VX589_15280 [Myxococcota bacterium]|nr:hypothetical protein [Myxococcota bacterium]
MVEMNRLDNLMEVFEAPERAALSDAQSEIVQLAQNAFVELEKLSKNIALYGIDHQSIERFQVRFHEAITLMIGERDACEIAVGPYELLVFDYPVMENPQPERNFIYKLYLDGVRRLAFRRGVTLSELNAFVQVLNTDWDDPKLFEDDSVTLLWSANLTYVNYAILDNFAEDIRADDDNVYTVPAVIERVRKPGEFSAGNEQSDGGVSRRLKRINLSRDRITPTDLASCREVYFAMDELEFVTLKRALHTTAREKLEKFIEILFKVHLIQESSEEDRRGRITALFDRLADLLLYHDNVGELERLLRTIRRLTGPEDRIIRENILAIEHIVEHWSSQLFVDRITMNLGRTDFKYTPSVIALCTLLSKRAVPHIARALCRIKDRTIRDQLLEIVASRIAGQHAAVSALLVDCDRESAHDLLQILTTVEDPDDIFNAIQRALENPEPKVRLEAMSAIPITDLNRFKSILFRALGDLTKSVRSKAIHLLARLSSSQVAERIITTIESDNFREYDLDEKRRFHAAAALCGHDVEYWQQRFSTSGLISSKQAEADRHCSAVALGIRMHRSALDALTKETKKRFKSPLVSEGAQWAIQHMDCSREERTKQLYDLFFYGRLTMKQEGS